MPRSRNVIILHLRTGWFDTLSISCIKSSLLTAITFMSRACNNFGYTFYVKLHHKMDYIKSVTIFMWRFCSTRTKYPLRLSLFICFMAGQLNSYIRSNKFRLIVRQAWTFSSCVQLRLNFPLNVKRNTEVNVKIWTPYLFVKVKIGIENECCIKGFVLECNLTFYFTKLWQMVMEWLTPR